MVAVSSSSTSTALVTGEARRRSARGRCRAVAAECDRVLQAGQSVVGGNFVGEIVLVDHDLGFAVLDDVTVFRQLMPDIERDGHGAEARDREHHHDEFDAVANHHGDAVVPLDAERSEAAGNAADQVVEFAIGDGLFAADEGDARRTARDGVRRAFR